jgi:DNA ligase-1
MKKARKPELFTFALPVRNKRRAEKIKKQAKGCCHRGENYRGSGMTKKTKLTRPNVETETNFNQNPELNPGALIDFASVAEQVGATTKRLTKASLLGSYFTSLSDKALVLAARYFSGYIFPLRDQRTINIGGAALLTAIAAVSEQEKSALQERLVKLGDPGDVTQEAFTNNPQLSQHQPILTLSSLSNQLELLAATTGSKRKTELVIELLKIGNTSRSQIYRQAVSRRFADWTQRRCR